MFTQRFYYAFSLGWLYILHCLSGEKGFVKLHFSNRYVKMIKHMSVLWVPPLQWNTWFIALITAEETISRLLSEILDILLLFCRCWGQNINMNYWWIIRSPILLAVVVIFSTFSLSCGVRADILVVYALKSKKADSAGFPVQQFISYSNSIQY